jgi:hypothetical protein
LKFLCSKNGRQAVLHLPFLQREIYFVLFPANVLFYKKGIIFGVRIEVDRFVLLATTGKNAKNNESFPTPCGNPPFPAQFITKQCST